MENVDISKMSKKAQKEYYAKQRGLNGFNTGTRTMQTPKHPSRAKSKEQIKKEINE